eukprot:766645-Hanusia_phi.AAC.1
MGIVSFVYPDSPQQVAAGCVVAFWSLMMAIYLRPFVNHRLNTLYQLSLLTQTTTLFCNDLFLGCSCLLIVSPDGIILHIQSMQNRLNEPITGQTEETTFSVIVIVINVLILVLPIFLWVAQEDVIKRIWRFLVANTRLRKILAAWVGESRNGENRINSAMQNYALYPARIWEEQKAEVMEESESEEEEAQSLLDAAGEAQGSHEEVPEVTRWVSDQAPQAEGGRETQGVLLEGEGEEETRRGRRSSRKARQTELVRGDELPQTETRRGSARRERGSRKQSLADEDKGAATTEHGEREQDSESPQTHVRRGSARRMSSSLREILAEDQGAGGSREEGDAAGETNTPTFAEMERLKSHYVFTMQSQQDEHQQDRGGRKDMQRREMSPALREILSAGARETHRRRGSSQQSQSREGTPQELAGANSGEA